MRGGITKRGKDSYSIVISLGKDDAGKYKYQWETVKGSREVLPEGKNKVFEKNNGKITAKVDIMLDKN